MKLFKRRLKRIIKEAKAHWVFKVELALDDFEKAQKKIKWLEEKVLIMRSQTIPSTQAFLDNRKRIKELENNQKVYFEAIREVQEQIEEIEKKLSS